MSASTYVGRVGALAATLGVGAAVFTAPATAWADPTSPDTSGTSAQDTPASQATGDKASSPTRGQARGSRGPRASNATTSQSAAKDSQPSSDIADVAVPEVAERDVTPRRGSDSTDSASQQGADVIDRPAAAVAPKAASDTVAVQPVSGPAPAAAEAVPAPASTQAVTALIETVTTAVVPAPSVPALVPSVGAKAVIPTLEFPKVFANAANSISAVITSVATRLVDTFSGSPFAPGADSPVNWLVLAAARRQPLAAAATGAALAATPVTPTLVLNGYNVVASSVQIVESFTGRWAYWPGQPNMLQGRQDFNLVDPDTDEVIGGFSALITSGDPTSVGAHYVEMLVTANDGINVGTGAGQVPPVGSIISDFTLGLIGFSYSSMPSPAGAKVSVKLKTPFATIPLPLKFDASEGIVDHTFDNRPMDVTGGFFIAPADPVAEKVTGSIGLLPLFNSLQGNQEFAVYNANGDKVGHFDGIFTTTSDTLGIYTQAILVTANDGVNVGTQPGQTPPVGTVYNVAYFFRDDVWLLYSSMPQDSGDAITLKLGTPQGVTDLGALPLPELIFPQATFNASREPEMKSMIAPGGQKFVATSAVIPSGVNGLPPRDVQIQGYQQFDVYDFLGRKIGTVDADVENQWDSSTGTHSKAILITRVTSGDVGTTPLNVPPVGSVMNFIDFGNGFGIADAAIPQKGTNVNAFQFVTPLGNIPLLPSIIPVTHPEIEYFSPFL